MKTIKELGIKRTDAFNNESYWNNNGAYQKEGDELYEKLVPSEGAAETVHGELIRGINRLFHEYCNNGNGNAIEVVTPNDHPWDYDEDVDGEIDWDEIEEVNIVEIRNKKTYRVDIAKKKETKLLEFDLMGEFIREVEL